MELNVSRLEYAAKMALYVLVALLPIWFVPYSVGIELGRDITFGIILIVCAILWLLAVLARGELSYQYSPLLLGGALLLVVWGASTIFSATPLLSAILADPISERFSTLILGVLLMFLAGSVLKSREEVGNTLLLFILASAVAGVLSLSQLLFSFSPLSWVLSFVQGVDFNAVGTINSLAILYAASLLMAMGFLSSPSLEQWRGGARYVLYASIIIFVLNLLLINFRTSWIVMLVGGVFFFGFVFRNLKLKFGEARTKFSLGYLAAVGLITVSVVMLLFRGAVLRESNLPTEVSPSFRATLNVAKSVFKEGPKEIFLGRGPGTFGLLWSLYKDPTINQTVFWGVRFNQGFSWLSTVLPTVGILGALALVLFLAVALFIFLKNILVSGEEEMSLAISSFLGFVSLVVASSLYPANLTVILLLFLILGLLSFLLSKSREGAGGGFLASIWNITERRLRFESPWVVFLSSLLVIFFLSLGIAGLYFEIGRARAALYTEYGARELNRGSLDSAIASLERAVRLEPKNYRNNQALVQARIEKVRNLIQRAAGGENVAQEFQATVTQAVQDAQGAVALQPQEPILWRLQGAMYELIIPFIQGSERFAFSSYQKSAELDPFNPSIYVDLGRSALVLADRIQLISSQGGLSPQAREELGQNRLQALVEAEKALRKAIEVKGDFAPAHFLLAQTALRVGNLQAAIQSTENAKLAAPFDIGVAFQLGLLYYQSNNLTRSEEEFLRAATINPNYSNARYFLGLIYDRRGEKARAIGEFERIAVFNPDNSEVQRILENLRSGRSALSGIVPPAEPPEKRKEAPVRGEQ